MDLAGLIEAYRVAASDRALPYLVEDAELTAFFNEAERQACIRARLIHESANTNICTIPVVSGDSVCPLHPSVYELDHLAFMADGETRFTPVRLVSQEWLSSKFDDWRDMSGAPEYAIQSDTALRLIPRPDRDGALRLEGYRTPKAEMVANDDTPEINTLHHAHLVHWVLFRAYSIPDSELLDLEKAAKAEQDFTRYFGPMPDADLRRITREDVPQAVVAFMP